MNKTNIIGNTGLAAGTYNGVWSGSIVRLDDGIELETPPGPRGTAAVIVIVTEDGTATVERSNGRVKTPSNFRP